MKNLLHIELSHIKRNWVENVRCKHIELENSEHSGSVQSPL